MKKIIIIISFLFAGIGAFAQTTLPTSWGFNGALPNGWTLGYTTSPGPGYYTSSPSAQNPPSLKLYHTGDYLQINVSDDMGPLTYWIHGTGSGTWTGTFTVQESTNGTSWTSLHSFGNGAIDLSNYVLTTDNPAAGSRYIRFFYTSKVSGFNVGLDSVNIAVAPPSPAQEINVQYASADVPSGATVSQNSPLATNTPLNFTIQNLGTANSLTLSSAVITGSSDFSVSSFPALVVAGSSGTVTVNFTPSTTGTITADLTITNNDANEGTYVIHLYGVGGALASEPSADASALNFSNVKTYRFGASFTAASPAPDGYVVLMKSGSAVTEIPVDGTVYTRGDYVGGAQVVSAGTALSFIPRNIVAGTTYHVSVFPYNGPGVYRNYRTGSPLTGSTNTPATMMPGSEYTGIAPSSSTFITDLHAHIRPHWSVYYSDYDNTVLDQFESRDTTGGQRVVTCVYSGENKVYTDPWDWTTQNASREHSYCQSWMPIFSLLPGSPEYPQYNDQHHLFPVNQTQVNAVRSNNPYGEVATVISTYKGAKYGRDAAGNLCYEPRDEQKGDAARAIFYVCTAYDSSAQHWYLPSLQNQTVLKKWNFQDPPSSWEIARNDYIDSLQGNRNPFVDNSDWVCYIDFTNMSWIQSPASPCTTDVTIGFAKEKASHFSFSVSPNPSKGKYALLASGFETSQTFAVEICDMEGRKIFENKTMKANGEIDLRTQASGVYFMKVSAAGKSEVIKLVRE